VEGTATVCCLGCPPCMPHMYRTPPGRATTMSCASRYCFVTYLLNSPACVLCLCLLSSACLLHLAAHDDAIHTCISHAAGAYHPDRIGSNLCMVRSLCLRVCVHCIMSALQACPCLQSARYLLKNLLGSQTGRAPQGSASYLGNAKAEMKSKCEVSKAKQWREPDVQLAALRYCIVTMPTSILQHSVCACRLSHCPLCCSWGWR